MARFAAAVAALALLALSAGCAQVTQPACYPGCLLLHPAAARPARVLAVSRGRTVRRDDVAEGRRDDATPNAAAPPTLR